MVTGTVLQTLYIQHLWGTMDIVGTDIYHHSDTPHLNLYMLSQGDKEKGKKGST
jgi:hypothetical protein